MRHSAVVLLTFCIGLIASTKFALAQEPSDAVKFAEARIAFDKFKDCPGALRALNSMSSEGKKEATWLYYAAQVNECLKDYEAAYKFLIEYDRKVPGQKEVIDKIGELRYLVSKRQIELESKRQIENPHALWMMMKTALSKADGAEYFRSNLKGTLVPQLEGVLVEAKPACRPTQLLVAIGGAAEISLKLDKPLPGSPEAGTKFHWEEGVPVAFTSYPFLLTLETETAKLAGLKVTPCTASPIPPMKKRKQ